MLYIVLFMQMIKPNLKNFIVCAAKSKYFQEEDYTSRMEFYHFKSTFEFQP